MAIAIGFVVGKRSSIACVVITPACSRMPPRRAFGMVAGRNSLSSAGFTNVPVTVAPSSGAVTPFTTVYLPATISVQGRSFFTMYFIMLIGSLRIVVSNRARTPAGGLLLLITVGSQRKVGGVQTAIVAEHHDAVGQELNLSGFIQEGVEHRTIVHVSAYLLAQHGFAAAGHSRRLQSREGLRPANRTDAFCSVVALSANLTSFQN